MSIPTIDVQELKARLDRQDDFELLDVREPKEHAICNLPQAKLTPLRELVSRLNELDPDRRYVVMCKMGGRSAQAVALMRQMGLDATNVAGGILAWAKQIDPTMPTY